MQSDKILERIRRLLAMAGDTSSPNEAAIAAGRARKLMDEYQVSEWDLKTDKDEDFGEAVQIRQYTWHGMLGIAMAWLNDCNVTTDAVPGTTICMMKFQGYLVDAVTAKELWLYLMGQAEVQAKQVKGRKEPFKQGFAAGVQKQVREILKERNKIVTGNGTSLVVCKRNLVTERYGELRTSQVKRVANANYQAGFERGSKVSLNRQVGNTGGNTRLLG